MPKVDFEKVRSDMQERLRTNIDQLRQAQQLIRDTDTGRVAEADMLELNGLIASIIGKLQYQHTQNAKVKTDE